jgi:hypothetical protein
MPYGWGPSFGANNRFPAPDAASIANNHAAARGTKIRRGARCHHNINGTNHG